jgi:hypothetical protein
MTDGDTFLSNAKRLTFQSRIGVNAATLSSNVRDGWKLNSAFYNINTGQKYKFHNFHQIYHHIKKEDCIHQQI